MGLECNFDDLVATLNNLADIGDKISKKAVTDASEDVVEQQKKDAPRDSGDGANSLKVTKISKYKGGCSAQIGIDSSNWEETKGLYYQHFGYELWKNGKRVEPHVGWMNESFDKVRAKAGKKIIDEVSKELDKILK